MDNKSQTIKIEGASVELVERVTWGMQEEIRRAMYGSVKLSGNLGGKIEDTGVEFNADAITRSKYKSIELCIKKITTDDGKEVPFTKEWLDNLSVEDGDRIYDAVNSLTTPKKK